MANYTKTITVAVNVFGPEPTEKWSTSSTTSLALIWGQDYWGYSTVGLPINFTKGIFNSVNSDSSIARRFYVFPANTVATTSAVGKGISHYYTNAVANTTTVGKGVAKYVLSTSTVTTTIARDMQKGIFEAQSISDAYYPYPVFQRIIYNTITATSDDSIYKYRDGYSVTYGGQTEIGLWPRGTSYTIAAGTTTSWTAASAATTTWS